MMLQIVEHRLSEYSLTIDSGKGSERNRSGSCVDASRSLDMRGICGGRQKLKKADIVGVAMIGSRVMVLDLYYYGVNHIRILFGEVDILMLMEKCQL